MDFTADGILARMKGSLKNEDSRIEGSFTMDNLQAVSEELARFNAMLIAPLQDELAAQGSDMGTSGNEKHYVKWAKEATNAQGKRVAGNAKVSSPRDGTGNVYIAIVSTTAQAPTEEEIQIVQEYINTKRPVGANPVVSAAESIDVTIVCEIHKTAGYTEETVKSQIQADVQAHFLEIAFQSGVISLNFFKVSNIISAVRGVSEVEDLTINGKKDSITADYNKFFSLKGVIISVTE